MKKKPVECKDLTEIRAEIDELDRTIIKLIGQRYHFVQAAAKFKKNEDGVKAPDRVKAMIEVRRKWAQDNDLAPDIIEKIYRDLVAYFVKEEMGKWKNENIQS